MWTWCGHGGLRSVAKEIVAHGRPITAPSQRPARRLIPMTVTVDLPDDVLRRLRAEAGRRGISLDELLAEVAAGFPGDAKTSGGPDALRALTGIAPGAAAVYHRDEDWPE